MVILSSENGINFENTEMMISHKNYKVHWYLMQLGFKIYHLNAENSIY